jgi:dipeptidyl aminopeptidase/acylaminoacyl peptidase
MLSAAEAARDTASRFGELESAYDMALSADGSKMVFVGPNVGSATRVVVVTLNPMSAAQIARGEGEQSNFVSCDWSAADRLVCALRGLRRVQGVLLQMSRLLAMDADGGNIKPLGQRNSSSQLYVRQHDGEVVDWLNGVDGAVLMARSNVPEISTGTLMAAKGEGLGVDRVDTRTGRATPVERPGREVLDYVSDGQGNIRLMTTAPTLSSGVLQGVFKHFYRKAGTREWLELGTDTAEGKGERTQPLAVDSTIDAAYVLEPHEGRMALFRVALEGSLKKELVLASKEVDVDDVIRIGRYGRVIGATFATDQRRAEYFDPAYRALAASLAKALPQLPLIAFLSASADEKSLLVWASSDVDPGRFYIYDSVKKTLVETLQSRPALKGLKLSPVKSITYPATDGTPVPAYLTLPPGVTEAKGLPALVMPHGGPAARDEWGFDWLAQYFAQQGFAVLQPNYRGSSGYGDSWYMENGFKSWKTSIGDVRDAGKWLVSQGMADPSKLAIFGWSYGGYAALQVNALDADLFKAVVAVAPVTDLALLKTQAQAYTTSRVVEEFVGEGPHVSEGSPVQNVERFKAPVLMFHGDIDANVDLAQSVKMDKALRGAKKSSQLVVYPKLEHSLVDGDVRADMLRKSDAFLRSALKLPVQ